MDISGHSIFTGEELIQFIKDAQTVFSKGNGFYFYVGTNQDMNYDTIKEFFDCFELKKISKEELKVLEKFYLDCVGFVPDFSDEDLSDDEK
jgi:hypothetical protein